MLRRTLRQRGKLWPAFLVVSAGACLSAGCGAGLTRTGGSRFDRNQPGLAARLDAAATGAAQPTGAPVLALPTLPPASPSLADVRQQPTAPTPLIDEAIHRAQNLQDAVVAASSVGEAPDEAVAELPRPVPENLDPTPGSNARESTIAPNPSNGPAPIQPLQDPEVSRALLDSEPASGPVEPSPIVAPPVPMLDLQEPPNPAVAAEPDSPPPSPALEAPATSDAEPPDGGGSANAGASVQATTDLTQGSPRDVETQADREAQAVAEPSMPRPENAASPQQSLPGGDQQSDASRPGPGDAQGEGEGGGGRPLAVSALHFCRQVRGFGDFEPVPDETFEPGQTIILYCEMEGVTYEPVGPLFRSSLESTVEILPSEGSPAIWRRTLGTAGDTCRRPRRDYYVNIRFALPGSPELPPGSYLLRLQQTDTTSGRSASRTIALSIREP